ncbi:hypothetical protein SAMN05518871_105223 [Psychrobacillus sp. OK028]|uniref:tubby C-terminal domain-like protein n=1 Tax=Psychrobacillus sp. OK028 TaxID=1884359 RepID=UPI00088C7C15|nr:hypothetical protein [Psychrobacillus sp. OK028]SDN47330.1 hypothetical protein SAMN05518871_105223 [Psychrobacillus sp. OK028]
MAYYTYEQPINIEETPKTSVYNEKGEIVYTFKRYYSNGLKKRLDKLMDYRYFLWYNVYNTNDELVFMCKKVSRKGKVYFEAFDYIDQKKYLVAYDKWKELVPDLLITDGHLQIKLDKEMEDWSKFIYNEKEIARWKATLDNVFQMKLEVIDHSPVKNVAFFIAISQCALYIGS